MLSIVLFIGIAFLFGTFIGSFLNVCVHRLPRNESVVTPPSRCYSCGTHLTWYDNLPVIGWLLVWGRCRWCKTPFSARYLFAELGVGALTAATAWWVLEHGSPWMGIMPPVIALGLAFAAFLVLVWTLYVSSLIDIDHTIIPDEITKSFQLLAPFLAVAAGSCIAIEDPLPAQWLVRLDVFGTVTYQPMNLLLMMGVVVGVAVSLLLASVPVARWIYTKFTANAPWSDDDHRGFRLGVWWFTACTVLHFALFAAVVLIHPGAWWVMAAVIFGQAILGSLAGWFSLYVVGFLGTMAFRRNAMGFGDVKFLAPLGAFLGPVGVLYAFFGAAIVGTVIGLPMRLFKSTREVPFGPYLAVGALLALAFGRTIHERLFAGLL